MSVYEHVHEIERMMEIDRDELYKECVAALQGGLLLNGGDFNAVRNALVEAFENADKKLLNW